MGPTEDSDAREFDVGTLNEQSNRAKKAKLKVLVGGAVFIVAFGLFFLATDWTSAIGGTLSTVRLATLLIVFIIVGLVLSAIIPGIALPRGGANHVRIDDAGVEFNTLSGRDMQITWSDPRLSMKLLDFSQIPHRSELTGIRHVIRIGRVETPLSPEAFDELLKRAKRHGLAIRSSRASRWIYPSAVAPIVYRVSGRSGFTVHWHQGGGT